MRIGELAGAVGVTTRTVRHYHHLGLLPEPERLGNGYRDYTLRHAVVLARIRRLTELGLGLAEVRDVLAEDAGKDLAEVLTELDEDLARQEAAIRRRRERLRALLEREELPAEGPVSPELAALFGEVGPVSDSPMAAKDREILAMLDTTASPEAREQLIGLLGATFNTPGGAERARAAYSLLDALVDADTDDPRVDEAARALAACLPAELLPTAAVDPDGSHDSFLRAFYADFAPAQAEAIRRTLRILAEQQEDGGTP
ncbi:MerR family transcriptional regulator [Streptomyces lincolnensis]|uniref:MerR family transcriptional regulator n=1 Tax=Streptomyces lincolnensis TaxID=1915 RepID=UPI001E3DF99B|nr:MerR family transcriptional regulator [Streptomyces lincolnensis]MCD7439496.1 MerR family transcriptional regulator [Streptomyces lincolnensis]